MTGLLLALPTYADLEAAQAGGEEARLHNA
jgi:hypothetical protein